MTTNPTPAEFLDGKAHCREGREFALQFETMADVWEACEQPGWMFWILQRTTPLTKEQSVQMSVAFSEPHLDCVPEGEDRPRKAIEDAKKWLEDPTEENRIAASVSSRAAASAARAATYAATYAAANAANAAASVSASNAASAAYYTSAAAVAAAANAAFAAATDSSSAEVASEAAADAAKRKHCEIIRKIVANPFK